MYEDEEEADEATPIVEGRRAPVVVRREDVIASMYLGGTGAFLALPALCMWDATGTCALLVRAIPTRKIGL